ncbi:MAG: M14 family zinc carboxypeptidase [Pseudomonadota bacterium]
MQPFSIRASCFQASRRHVVALLPWLSLWLLLWLSVSTAVAAKPESKAASQPALKGEAALACQRVSDRLKLVAATDCRKSALVASGGRSRNGFPILVRRFSPPKSKDASRPAVAPPRILLIGGIHGDELTATAVVFQWMQLIDNTTANTTATSTVNSTANVAATNTAPQFDWKVVPLLNPDGLLAARPTRVNANGVDLNRNFPTPNWATEAPRYWVKETGSDPRRFPGKTPLSEPESRWVNDEIQRFKPHVIISVHAPFGVLDFDGPAPAPQRFGRLLLNPVGIYPGSLGNYSGKFKNIPVITIELPNALAMPTEAESGKIWSDMLDWITTNVAKRPA